jgi:hypothetical protein
VCGLFFRGKLYYDGVVLSIIVLAKLMGRQGNADEAVLIRVECELRYYRMVVSFGVCIEQEELKINVGWDLSTGDEVAEVN